MKKKQVLFVTYHDEGFEDGLSYAVDLAKVMNNNISLLMIYKRKVMERFEDMMTVVSFAEEGDHKTARELIKEDYKKNNTDFEEELAFLAGKCREAGIEVDVCTAAMNVLGAIKNLLRQNMNIGMVLLSPSITNKGNVTTKDLNRLVRTASRPVVTMAKNTFAA
jgi:hypothetical protein